MNTPSAPRQPALSAVFDAEARDAACHLRAALTAVGITLPSLDVAPCVPAASSRQLVELGRVSPRVAAALAAVVRRGGGTPDPVPRLGELPPLEELARRAEDLARQIHKHLDWSDEVPLTPRSTAGAGQ